MHFDEPVHLKMFSSWCIYAAVRYSANIRCASRYSYSFYWAQCLVCRSAAATHIGSIQKLLVKVVHPTRSVGGGLAVDLAQEGPVEIKVVSTR